MSTLDISHAAQVAKLVARDFYTDQLDLFSRGLEPGCMWSRMPEVHAVAQLRKSWVSPRTIRLFLTFMAAMNRPRDSARLWSNGVELWKQHGELFEPAEASAMPLDILRTLLVQYKVSLKHKPDSLAWHTIARSLSSPDNPISRVVDHGVGNATELLEYLSTGENGRARFPLLKGPKIGPMWLRMLAAPGGAAIADMDIIPVAVDVHVRRATQNLGVADTAKLSSIAARRLIQDAWQAAVAETDIGGPPGIANTCAALDPALWAFGKLGCGHCAKQPEPVPIGRACGHCQLRALSDA